MLNYINIIKNEKADEKAKKTTLKQLIKEFLLHHKLKSMQITKINEDISKTVKKTWNNEKTNAK